jgi:hypothetical protein
VVAVRAEFAALRAGRPTPVGRGLGEVLVTVAGAAAAFVVLAAAVIFVVAVA